MLLSEKKIKGNKQERSLKTKIYSLHAYQSIMEQGALVGLNF
jgi:hypothetical protein